jgi:Uma2 family endonuclease
MGMPLFRDAEWTAELARALPDDGKRYEVLDGELFVTPAPARRHQLALAELYNLLLPFVREHSVGVLLWSPADIEFSPHRLVQPDLFVEPPVTRSAEREWRDVKALVLAVEVLAPGTARADRHHKRRIYMTEDVEEYWIVDLDARVIERWRKGREGASVEGESLEWQPASGRGATLALDVAQYFAHVLDIE